MPNSEQSTPDFRSGFVTLVGRPNTGKSTLINALVGEKIAITSTRPQTTRRIIRGVISRPQGQLILVDTPGLHRPRTLLGERLNAIVAEAYSDVDLIACCFLFIIVLLIHNLISISIFLFCQSKISLQIILFNSFASLAKLLYSFIQIFT